MEGAGRNTNEGTGILVEGRKVTYNDLLRLGACDDYRDQFRDDFGLDGEVLVTVDLAVEQADRWDWQWAAHKLLTPEGYEEWETADKPAIAAYRAGMRPVWDVQGSTYTAAQKAEDAVWSTAVDVDSRETLRAAMDARKAVMEPYYEMERVALKTHVLSLQQHRARHFAELFIKEGDISGS